jgi:DUF4097 and DUF4098 domain-containing protein YvlB
MTRLRTLHIACLLLATALPAAAQQKSVVDRYSRALPLSFDGTFRLESPNGNITVQGTEQPQLTFVAERVVTGIDDAAVNDGRKSTGVHIGSDGHNVLLQSLIPFPNPTRRWNVAINYTVKVPRTVHVQAFTGVSDRIYINNIAGNVFVKNASGKLDIVNVSGSTQIETSNGDVSISLLRKPTTNIRASSINGKIEILLPKDSAFNWTAEALRGEILTNLNLRGDFDPSRPGKFYRGVANGPNGPRIETFSVMGTISIQGRGIKTALARLIPGSSPQPQSMPAQNFAPALVNQLLQRPSARNFVYREDHLDGDLEFATSLGNIFIGELRGSGQISTRAGEIVINRITGLCDVESLGGPINLGEVGGPLNARTEAGDVTVRTAARGGIARTTGGNIIIGYAGGPMNAVSGGGDVTIRRALSMVNAETRSGDASITFDPAVKSQRVDARVMGGNILLTLGPSFGADVDVTIITSNPDDNSIRSDFPGLTFTTEQAGGRSRLRAVGKINGGGQKVQLYVEEGNVQIRSRG